MAWRDAPTFRAETVGADVELAYAGIPTFLKREYRGVDELGGMDAAVLGVPYDGAVSNRPGARYGPGAIRRASGWWGYLSAYKAGLTNIRTGSQVHLGDLGLADCGDASIFPMDRETTTESIEAHVATLASQTLPLVLGGDHYCTYPAFLGYAKGAGHDRVGLVQIDAHTDTVTESPVFGDAFHGSSTALIADSPYGGYGSVSQVAIRGYESPAFFEFVDREGLHLFTMADVEERGIEPVIAEAVAAAAADTDAVYVTFDIDAVDPSVAPGTGTPVPGGLSASQALRVMEQVGASEAIGAVDVMEVAPRYDPTGGTARLAAYLLVTFLDRRFTDAPRG